ncbi:MAG: alkylation response protein AidB-like acyl-CoA dehydrogenase [Myxococcota bacterium]|jgi:alkylation response protein AidB-like acyl-CoA dehydrogenase
MDFARDELQEMVGDLSKQIFRGLVTTESLDALEKSGQWMHRAVWAALAQSELLSAPLPESMGGMGCDIGALAVLLEHAGRTVAPVPALETLVLGVLPLAHFGTPEQQARYLDGVGEGRTILTAALTDAGSRLPLHPTTTATGDTGTVRLTGVKRTVAYADEADFILATAATPSGTRLVIFAADDPGVSSTAQTATNGQPLLDLALTNVSAEVIGGAAAPAWLLDRANVGMAALSLGVARQALIMTANYVSERQQFGRPIGTFQAVSQRAADAWMDVEAMDVSLMQAAWRLSAGVEVGASVALARYWACEGGHRVVAAAQHLHGGTGFDRDYALYRFFLWSKRLEFGLGGGGAQLELIGRMIGDGMELG